MRKAGAIKAMKAIGIEKSGGQPCWNLASQPSPDPSFGGPYKSYKAGRTKKKANFLITTSKDLPNYLAPESAKL